MTEGSAEELSPREVEILKRVGTGATNQQIARDLGISVNTVKAHLRNVFTKLQVESRTEAVLWAIRSGIIEAPRTAPQALEEQFSATEGRLQELRWPLNASHYIAVLVILLALVAAAAWPIEGGQSSIEAHRLVDMPSALPQDAPSQPVSRWQLGAHMPTPRGRFAYAAWNGSIYVIAGLGRQGWSDRVEVYDPLHDAWRQAAPKPLAAANVAGVAVQDLIYVSGGLDASGQVRDVLEIYDPHADTWRRGEPMPHPLCAYAVAAYGDGFFVMGGWDGQRYQDTIFYYDANAATWRRVGELPSPRAFAAAALVQGRVFLTGGYEGSRELMTCESFEAAGMLAGQPGWRTHSAMSAGRAGHGMAASRNELYVVGGGLEVPFTYNERYDIGNDVWSQFESPVTGQWTGLGLLSMPLDNIDFLYAIGGWNGRYLDVVQSYQTFFRVYLP